MLSDIKNFVALSPLLGTAGMPTAEQIDEIARAGYVMVINLALPSYSLAIPDEGGVVAAQGLTYVNIPVDFEHPTVEDFESFAAILRANRERKVFVHCALNYRVSAFMYLYRVTEKLIDIETARTDLLRLWQPEGIWAELIRQILSEHGIEGAGV